MSMTDALDIEIRSLVTELMESAPLAPRQSDLGDTNSDFFAYWPGHPRIRSDD